MMPAYRSPTPTIAPVAGATSGLYTFAQAAALAWITNNIGEAVFLSFNTTTPTGPGTFDVKLADEGELRLDAAFGLGAIETVGVWVPAGGDVSKFTVRGQ